MMSEERDREVDTAWRAASVEEPPAALDDAIRAEARRAVEARPGDARRRRYRQWRYPFAAAATVALLTFGILQMIPPDQLAPGVVSDQLATPRERAAELQPPAPSTQPAENAPQAKPGTEGLPPVLPQAQSAPPPPSESGATAERRSAAASDVRTKKERQRQETSAGERLAAAPSRAAPPPQAEAQAPAEPSVAAATAKLAQSPPTPEAANSAAGGSPENARRSQPFPAASPSAGASDSAASPNAPRPAAAAAPRRDMSAEASKREQSPAVAVGSVKSRADAAPPAQISSLDELKAKQAGAQSVEAWIARIRSLKESGDLAAAAKELAAFRDAYGDRADVLLPRDLRGVTTSDSKGH